MSDTASTAYPGVSATDPNINARRLLWAGFISLLAEGVGFGVRGGILKIWSQQYGFSMTELGQITGGGLTGFGVIIIISSFIADKVGYGTLMISAFGLHFLSAVVTLAAGWAFAHGGRESALHCLTIGMFMFAMGNGLCEGVANPLVAALFKKDKSKYLNILHAGWPGGLIIGSLVAYFMAGGNGRQAVAWQIQMSLFLIPVVIYGAMLIGQKFPKSEASEHKVKYKDMLRELGLFGALILCILLGIWFSNLSTSLGLPAVVGWVGALLLWLAFGGTIKFFPGYFLMVVLLILHAMQGYVELGTDAWIPKVTDSILQSSKNGLLLFAYINGLMFILRFFAGPIVHKISPLGLLFGSAILGAVGLVLLGHSDTAVFCVLAASVYAVGKTFVWPTLLAVASEQFPKGGAITIGAMGSAGMLCAGLLGGPGIGFNQDSHVTTVLQAESPSVYERYKAESPVQLLMFKTMALDGAKVGVLENNGESLDTDPNLAGLKPWWATAKTTAAQDKAVVEKAQLQADKSVLVNTSIIPATQAIILLCILIYFRTKGGYKQVHIEGQGGAAHEVA